MYAICVQNGIPPLYFLDDMEEFELLAILKNYNDNLKLDWEKIRLINYYSIAAMTDQIKAPNQLYRFEWENVEDKKEESEEEIMLRMNALSKKIMETTEWQDIA